MTATSTPGVDPFDALRDDWKSLCRRRRRWPVTAGWAETDPALAGIRELAEVIPAENTDGSGVSTAMARLHRGGDALAGRVLLQLLLPGLIELASRCRWRFPGGMPEAATEIVSLAGIYVGRLRDHDITCSPPGYVLRSVHRDLVKGLLAESAHSTHLTEDGDVDAATVGSTGRRHPSAEDVVASSTSIWDHLAEAVRTRRVSRHMAQVLWLDWAGWTPKEIARLVPYSGQSIYRLRESGYAHLQAAFADRVLR